VGLKVPHSEVGQEQLFCGGLGVDWTGCGQRRWVAGVAVGSGTGSVTAGSGAASGAAGSGAGRGAIEIRAKQSCPRCK
jgi:hypothetical protein